MAFVNRLGPGPPLVRRVDFVLISVTLFLSGFCGIAYEVLYARLLGTIIGDHFAVNASILVTFLLGIGLGMKFAYRLQRYLWAVEGTIGLYALAFVVVLPKLDYFLFQTLLVSSLAANVFVACLILLIPAFLVGVSLPLFAAYLQTLVPGRVFTISYMVYNFGAALTALLIEFYLIRHLGLRAATLFIASVNLGIGTLLFLRRGGILGRLQKHLEIRYPLKTVLPLIVLSFASAIFQLTMLKFAEFIFGPYHETFAMVLGITLLGIALGTLLTHLFKIQFATFLVINLIYVVFLNVLFKPLLIFMATYYQNFQGVSLTIWKLWILFLIMGVSSVCFGAAIPALMQKESDVARESGHLLFVSSMANAAGYLTMIFVVHALFEYGAILFLIALLLALAAVLTFWPTRRPAVFVVVILVGGLFLKNEYWQEKILYYDYMSFTSLEKFHQARSTYQGGRWFRKYDETFSINTYEGQAFFFINGYTSIDLNTSPEYVVGFLSSLISPRKNRGLVLGLGSGATAGTVAEIFDTLETVEISPLILSKQHLFRQYSFGIMAKPNVEVYCDDGLHFLKMTDRRYDLILNTVTTPLYFSSSKLYTREFLDLVKEHLRPDGIYTTWVDSRVGDRGVRIILRTLQQEFQYCWVVVLRPEYFLLLCSNTPLELREEERLFTNRRLGEYFFREHGRDMRSFPYAIINTNPFGFLQSYESVPVNTMDFPVLEFEMTRIPLRTLQAFPTYLLEQYSLEAMNQSVFKNRGIELNHLVTYYLLRNQQSLFARYFLKLAVSLEPNFLPQYEKYLLNFFDTRQRRYPSIKTKVAYAFWLEFFDHIEEAMEVYQGILELNTDLPEVRYKIGRLQYQQNQLEAARTMLEQELLYSPSHALAMFLLGKINLELGNYAQAIHWLKRCLGLRPDLEGANRALGEAYLKSGDETKARLYFQKELDYYPEGE